MDDLAKQQRRKQHDERRIAAEQYCYHRRVGFKDRELVERHADGNANEAKQSKYAQVRSLEPYASFFHPVHRERNQEYPPNEKTRQRQLHGIKIPRDLLKRDLHRTEQYDCRNNINPTFFHKKDFLSFTTMLSLL